MSLNTVKNNKIKKLAGNSNQAELDAIKQSLTSLGTITEGTLSAKTVQASTWTSVGTLTLNKGKYIIRGSVYYQDVTSYSHLSINTALNINESNRICTSNQVVAMTNDFIDVPSTQTYNLLVFTSNQLVTPKSFMAIKVG